MKKVILGAAALLFTGVLFAQNTSTSSQSGTDQRVYVLEQRVKDLQTDKKNNQRIINNNNSNAVIYSGKEQ